MSHQKLINISAYCTPEEYDHLKNRREAYIERTGRKVSISRFIIEQPDRQESELNALKRVYELHVGIVELYQEVNSGVRTLSAPGGDNEKQRKTSQRVMEDIDDSARESDKHWEDRNADGKRKYDSDGNLLLWDEETQTWKPKPKPTPHLLMLNELKQRFKEKNQTQ